MENTENRIKVLIDNVYKDNQYPRSEHFIITEQLAEELGVTISKKCNVDAVDLKCKDCHYCYMLSIIPGKNDLEKAKPSNKRSGETKMFVALSKLGRYAMIYWFVSKRIFLFKIGSHIFKSPDAYWNGIERCIIEAANELDIEIIDSTQLHDRFNVKYQGKIIGFDPNPELWKLLFTEELHI